MQWSFTIKYVSCTLICVGTSDAPWEGPTQHLVCSLQFFFRSFTKLNIFCFSQDMCHGKDDQLSCSVYFLGLSQLVWWINKTQYVFIRVSWMGCNLQSVLEELKYMLWPVCFWGLMGTRYWRNTIQHTIQHLFCLKLHKYLFVCCSYPWDLLVWQVCYMVPLLPGTSCCKNALCMTCLH